MVSTIICEVGTITCDIGTINLRFYLLEVQYHMDTVKLPVNVSSIVPHFSQKAGTKVKHNIL